MHSLLHVKDLQISNCQVERILDMLAREWNVFRFLAYALSYMHITLIATNHTVR